jgi:gliding motility-associated-like protein
MMTLIGFSQSDNCSSATTLTVGATCVPVNGTTTGATQSIAGCSGNADDDVWYQFVATATSHQITTTASATFDPVIQLFSGACSALITIVCKDDNGSGVSEIVNASGLTIGATYRLRVYNYGVGSGSGTFTICVSNPPSAPTNDFCGNAVTLPVNSACTYTSGTTDGATQSFAGCSGTADDDVWFKFVATNAVQNIKVHPVDNLDMVVQVYSGTCAALSSLSCQDNSFTAQDEQFDIVGLVPGQTYYLRVYDYYAGNSGDFQICVTGTSTAAPTNDEACTAIQLPTVTSTCQYSVFSTVGATASTTSPTPASCVGGSAPQQGGFSTTTKDIWFKITVPSTGNIHITSKPNMGAGSITDGVMVLYSGTCSALTQIACSDDHSLYPGTANDLLPLISASGLTPGSTVYLRYFAYGSGSGNFGICVTTATNDNCANALYICDINGYSASTSAAYTPDRPSNMRGNNEDVNGVNMPDGTNTGGIFGQPGSWGAGSPLFDVIINNNSWIKFTASSTSAVLQVSIYDCWVGNYPSGGIQMQVFEGNNCTNFVPVSDFKENSTGFSITANNLTVGNDYYLMVDGYAGDICNYTITAQSGVQFPDIANVAPICTGGSVTLSAPSGASSYEWQHDGSTTQTVTVSPSTTQTYYCEVSGLCGYKQMLDVTVTVNPNPTVSITNGSSTSICNGETESLSVTGATTYTWNTGASGSSLNVSPTSTTTYTVTGTTNGCTATDNISVIVNSNPTLSVNPVATNSNCGASTGALNGAVGSGSGTLNYTWTNGSGAVVGTTQNISNIPAGVYYLNILDANGCSSDFGPFNVINPGAPAAPSITYDDNSPCLNGNAQFIASSASAGATFNWSGPNGFSTTGSIVDFTSVDINNQGNYCVTATVAGCTGPSTCQSLIVLSPPPVDIAANGNDSTICLNSSFSITAAGAINYSWTGPGFTSNSASITITDVTSANQGYYTVIGTDANGCINEDSILITVLNLPVLNVSTSGNNDIFCLNSVISLSASGAINYLWSGPNSFVSAIPNPFISDATAVNEGWYYVEGVDVENCSSSDSIYVKIITNVPAQSSSNDTLVCPGESIVLYGNGGEAYFWTGPLSFSDTNQNVTLIDLQIEQSGWYNLTVTDSNGCLGYDSTHITVEYNADCLFIPDLITPDFDGHNDTWVVNGLENYSNAEVEIYNRWGNLVYYSSPYNNDWDGAVNRGATIDGKDGKVPVGTYFYIIKLNEGDKPPFKGYIDVQF